MHFEPCILNRYRINVQNETEKKFGENITDVKVICNVILFIEYRNDREPAVLTIEGIFSK